jgi:hypothetical protein
MSSAAVLQATIAFQIAAVQVDTVHAAAQAAITHRRKCAARMVPIVTPVTIVSRGVAVPLDSSRAEMLNATIQRRRNVVMKMAMCLAVRSRQAAALEDFVTT